MTLIDPHLGTIDDFRETIEDIHSRGMYIMLDITISTYGITCVQGLMIVWVISSDSRAT